jgi:hypothetical protein
MAFDIVVWATVIWMAVIAYIMETENFHSKLVFKIVPTFLSIALAVVWALERGFIINIGG